MPVEFNKIIKQTITLITQEAGIFLYLLLKIGLIK
jgi:hypothetical protein